MTEYSKLEDMNSENLSSSCKVCELEEKGTQKISVNSDEINSLKCTNIKSDSFIVDMERFSHLTDKDVTANSRINKLQRNFSRKWSQRERDARVERDTGIVATSSPRAAATLAGASTPEKSMVVTVGANDHPVNPQAHHQITIMTGNVGATTAESRFSRRRFSFRRSSPSWAIDPRRILFFFATLSSMGTILLIYFTLSIRKLNGDDNTSN